jgi:hypothetical protein
MINNDIDPDQLVIFNKIDDILYNDWNPIGIAALPRDEYQSYTPKIFKLKIGGASSSQIAEHLYKLESKMMGLHGRMDHCEYIARMIAEI